MLKRRLTALDLLGLDNVSDVQVSPDGQRIAFVRRIRDLESARSSHRIWMVDLETEEQSPVSDPQVPCIAPRWSPDGTWISWLELGNGKTSLSLRSTASPATVNTRIELPTGSHHTAWSPSGDRMAFLAPAVRPEIPAKTPGVKVVEPDDARVDLCVVRLSDQSVVRVTEDRFAVTDLSWHPSGESLAVCATPSSDPTDWDHGDLWWIPLGGGSPRRLLEGRCTRAIWSPDGSQLAVVRLGTPSFLATPKLEIARLDGNPDVFDPFDEEFQLLAWTKEGLLALSIDGPSSHLYRIDPATGDTARIQPHAPEGFTVIEGWFGQGCSLSQDQTRMAFTAYDVDHPGEAAVLELKTGRLHYLTDLLRTYRDWGLPRPERFSWTSSDGTPLSGVLIRPSSTESANPAPLIVALHGGPTAMASQAPFADNDWIWAAIPMMLQRGAAILLPDYRGSAGYGSAFRRMNERSVGLANLDDVESAIDALSAKGWIDPDRVGAVGASHGGFLSALLATATDRLAAAVCRSGITDWTLNFSLNQNPDWERQYFGGAPWERSEAYAASSPVTYASRARTPILFLHGTEDRQAPTANACALHRALTDREVPTRLILFEGAGHGGGNLRQLEQGIDETVQWFEDWLSLS